MRQKISFVRVLSAIETSPMRTGGRGTHDRDSMILIRKHAL